MNGPAMPGPVGPLLLSAKNDQLPIETARAVATLLLVTYHVIGDTPDAGLQIDYPSPLRLFADFLVDLRMPLFAMIAGMVFAMKPLSPSGLPRFFAGKWRRLAVPGAIAIFAYMISARFGDTQMDVQSHFLLPFLTGYAHFWFLQSILLIFLAYAPLDSMTHGRIAPYALLAACLLSLSQLALPYDVFSTSGAMMLLPYFVLGVIVWRQRAQVLAHRHKLLAAALVMLIIGSALNIQILRETGVFSENRRDLQSLVSATGGCMLAMLALPHVKTLDRIAALSFTIYLYHVFGTSLMRRFLEGLGIDNLPLLVIAGIFAGIALPVAIHKLAARHNLSRVLVLGIRPLHSQHETRPTTPSRAT